MKLELISPAQKHESLFPPLGLGIIAALTPKDIDVSIIDEGLEPIDFAKDVDVVAITVHSATAPRAYEIADDFRQRGTPVVLGGPHASALPNEAIQHADAVCIGEAEGYWERLISDFRAGKLQKFYHCEEPPSLKGLPLPRRDLFKKEGYMIKHTVETTRGCPFNCNFCYVSIMFGYQYRFRPVEEVIREIEIMKPKYLFFVDDNIVGNINRAKELFRALIPYNIKWIAQGSLSMARDEELLELIAKSGCLAMFIGFESLSQASLNEANILKTGIKGGNVMESYAADIRKIHNYGIGICGSFVFGFDSDDETAFEKTVKFAQENDIEAAHFGMLTPFPDTPLYAKLESEGRIIERNWSKYDCDHVVIQPAKMSIETLEDGYYWSLQEFYSAKSILQRLGIYPIRLLFKGKKIYSFKSIIENWIFGLAFNLSIRKSVNLPEGKMIDMHVPRNYK